MNITQYYEQVSFFQLISSTETVNCHYHAQENNFLFICTLNQQVHVCGSVQKCFLGLVRKEYKCYRFLKQSYLPKRSYILKILSMINAMKLTPRFISFFSGFVITSKWAKVGWRRTGTSTVMTGIGIIEFSSSMVLQGVTGTRRNTGNTVPLTRVLR